MIFNLLLVVRGLGLVLSSIETNCNNLICQHGGTCVQLNRSEAFCKCPLEYKGIDCSEKISLTQIFGSRCGKQEDVLEYKRIIGGVESRKGLWPWHAQLRIIDSLNTFLCGGSIIGRKWIISALHCVRSIFKKNRQIRIEAYLGNHTINGGDKYYIDFVYPNDTTKYTVWPDLTNSLFLHDIVLLRTRKEIEYSKFIQPICLPSSHLTDEEKRRKEFYAVGFGRFLPNHPIFGKSVARYLRHTGILLNSFTSCAKKYKLLYPYVLCSIKSEDIFVHGTCHGDSGGSLSSKKNGDWTLYGITSGGNGICNGDGYYVDVSLYFQWIVRTMVNN
ncbi:hypothetical protein SNEBB_000401 [Seison nebaliae]|nr:hypothetical protein SNEBB_000401 [Seison nebaliae]